MKHRAVNVGGSRAATRLSNLVAEEVRALGYTNEQAVAIARAVVRRAHDEGFALTWQTS